MLDCRAQGNACVQGQIPRRPSKPEPVDQVDRYLFARRIVTKLIVYLRITDVPLGNSMPPYFH